MSMPADLGTVEDRNFVITDFRLQSGAVMAEAKIAYETYGRLAADGRNAVLITHGYTSSHHAAGRSPANGDLPGWWDGLIGPGKAIDTDRLFVVSSNMLGSSFGSTNGASINPRHRQALRTTGDIDARAVGRWDFCDLFLDLCDHCSGVAGERLGALL